jgi:DNA-binding transcriptional ArsR family regulator
MTIRQEIEELRAFANATRLELDRLVARLNALEKRVLKDTSGETTIGRRIQFKNGPRMVHGVLRHAADPMSRAEVLDRILMDYPEIADDMDYAKRAVRNALQVLKRQGKVSCHKPQGRLRETLWWAEGMEFADVGENGEAAIGGLGKDEHGRVK